MQKEIKDLIKSLSIKYNKPEHVIEEICMSQLQFLKENISKSFNEEMKTIQLPKFGKFTFSSKRKEWINKYKEKKSE